MNSRRAVVLALVAAALIAVVTAGSAAAVGDPGVANRGWDITHNRSAAEL